MGPARDFTSEASEMNNQSMEQKLAEGKEK